MNTIVIDGIHMMIDIETLGTKPGCFILSVGARVFNLKGTLDQSMYRKVRLSDLESSGLKIESGTLEWWLQQSPEAIAEAFGSDKAISLRSVLGDLNDFIIFHSNAASAEDKGIYFWANSPAFDFTILEAAFDKLGMKWPIPYWAQLDMRTINTLYTLPAPPDMPGAVAHDAYWDTIIQSERVRLFLNTEAGRQ